MFLSFWWVKKIPLAVHDFSRATYMQYDPQGLFPFRIQLEYWPCLALQSVKVYVAVSWTSFLLAWEIHAMVLSLLHFLESAILVIGSCIGHFSLQAIGLFSYLLAYYYQNIQSRQFRTIRTIFHLFLLICFFQVVLERLSLHFLKTSSPWNSSSKEFVILIFLLYSFSVDSFHLIFISSCLDSVFPCWAFSNPN